MKSHENIQLNERTFYNNTRNIYFIVYSDINSFALFFGIKNE